MNALGKIQAELKAPKNQFNAHGKYKYRSCEDILEGVKPLLQKHGATMTISDDIEAVGGRVYVRAVVKFQADDGTACEVAAYAREAEARKGMDDSQITGAASSYARKYALNGLFLIDDTKDADHEAPKQAAPRPSVAQAPEAPPFVPLADVLKELEGAFSQAELADIFKARYPMAKHHYRKNEMDQLLAKKDELKKALAA